MTETPPTGVTAGTPENADKKEVATRVTRMPRALEALYLKPLRREAEFGVPTCDLQLRAYTPRNLEFFCDFALRAAYYLGLPAFGPVPLPRLVQRWTVPKSVFVHKKSQENFERITLRRLIQIRDGHPETVQIWLAFLQKHAYYGIGMKANIWEFSKLGMSLACLPCPARRFVAAVHEGEESVVADGPVQVSAGRWMRAPSRRRSCWRTSGTTWATLRGVPSSSPGARAPTSSCLPLPMSKTTWPRRGGGSRAAGKGGRGGDFVVVVCIDSRPRVTPKAVLYKCHGRQQPVRATKCSLSTTSQ